MLLITDMVTKKDDRIGDRKIKAITPFDAKARSRLGKFKIKLVRDSNPAGLLPRSRCRFGSFYIGIQRLTVNRPLLGTVALMPIRHLNTTLIDGQARRGGRASKCSRRRGTLERCIAEYFEGDKPGLGQPSRDLNAASPA